MGGPSSTLPGNTRGHKDPARPQQAAAATRRTGALRPKNRPGGPGQRHEPGRREGSRGAGPRPPPPPLPQRLRQKGHPGAAAPRRSSQAKNGCSEQANHDLSSHPSATRTSCERGRGRLCSPVGSGRAMETISEHSSRPATSSGSRSSRAPPRRLPGPALRDLAPRIRLPSAQRPQAMLRHARPLTRHSARSVCSQHRMHGRPIQPALPFPATFLGLGR